MTTSWWRKWRRRQRKSRRNDRQAFCRPVAEQLERRLLLAVFQTAAPVGNGADALSLRVNPSTLQIELVDITAFAVLDSASLVNLDGIEFTGADNEDDTLAIDFTGLPALTAGISIDGGAAGNDTLVLVGGPQFDLVTHTPTAADAGTIALTAPASQTITYTGLEPIRDDLSAVDREFSFAVPGDLQVRLLDDGDGGNGRMMLDSNNSGAFETIIFASPSGALTINGGPGNDTISLLTLDGTFAGSLTVNGDQGNDGIDASLLAIDVTLNGDAGNDLIFAGDGNDLVNGGPDNDTIADGLGSDVVDVGPGDDVLLSTPGSNDIFIDGGGDDTVDFSLDDTAITIDLDSTAVQTVDAHLNTIQLVGQWENFTGSPFDDAVYARPLPVPRQLNSGPGNDQLVLNALGELTFFDGNRFSFFGGLGDIDVSSFAEIDTFGFAPRIVDDSDPADFAHTGFGDSDPNFPQGFGGGIKFSAAGAGNTASWSFPDIPPGFFGVAATWTSAPDRATNSPFTIREGGAGGPIVAQVAVNQELAPTEFFTDGVFWNILDVVRVTGNELTVELTDVGADDFVIADAVRLVPIGTDLIIDDNDPGFSGANCTPVPGTGTFGDFNNCAANGTAEWTFSGLSVPPGVYNVSATWTPGVNQADQARFLIQHAGTETSRVVNQTFLPQGFVDAEKPWQHLGQINFDPAQPLVVRLQNDDVVGTLFADAVRIERAPVAQVFDCFEQTSTNLTDFFPAGCERLNTVSILSFREDTGLDAASIQDTVDAFRNDLGPLNVDRREINWDAVPDNLAAPNPFPGDFFNTTRGAVFSTPGSGFQVSATAASSNGERFDNLNPSYSTAFSTFSPERLFTPLGSNVTEITFFVPGTSTPAAVSGFGAVFTDVDFGANSQIEFLDSTGSPLFTQNILPTAGDGSLSFLGVQFAGAPIARVRITSGSGILGPDDITQGGAEDLVVLDDFIFGEPQPLDGKSTVNFPPSVPNVDLTRTFVIENRGDAPLIVGPPAVNGIGFSLLDGPNASSLPPGGYTTYRLKAESNAEADLSGNVMLPSTDLARLPYSYDLTGRFREDLENPSALIEAIQSGLPLIERKPIPFRVTATDNIGVQNVELSATGYPLPKIISTAPGQFQTPQFVSWVSGGKLELQFKDEGGADSSWVVNGLEITQLGDNARLFDFNRAADPPTADASPTRKGYIGVAPDDLFSPTRGFGWLNAPSGGFDRGTLQDDLERDGHFESQPRTFRVAVPDDQYRVTVVLGDRLFPRDNIEIQVNNEPPQVVNPAAGDPLRQVFNVNVSGGLIDVDIADLGGDPFWVINGLEIVPAAAPREQFDFNDNGSPTQAGFTPVAPGDVFNAGAGFGWDAPVVSFDRGAPDDLRRDGHLSSSPRTFRVDLTDDAYLVKVTLGDASQARDDIEIGSGKQTLTSNGPLFEFEVVGPFGDRIRLDAVATDLAGNTGADGPLVLPVLTDEPPQVRIVTPADETQLIEGTAIPIMVDVTDDVGVVRVDFLVNGVVVESDFAAPFDAQVQLPTASQLEVLARAVDSGNQFGFDASRFNVFTPIALPAGGGPFTGGAEGGDFVLRGQGGGELFRRALSGLPGLQFNGGPGVDDTLDIDLTDLPPAISFNGGDGGFDTLVIRGGPFNLVTHTPTGPDRGSAQFDGQTLFYTGLEPILDNTSATDRVFTLAAPGDQQLRLLDEGTPGDGLLTIDSNGTGGFESITFSNPTSTLTISGGEGNDVLTVVSLDAGFAAALTLDGGPGKDTLDVSAVTAGATLVGGPGADLFQAANGVADTLDGEAADFPLVADVDFDSGLDTLAGVPLAVNPNGSETRRYRLAVAATEEYTTFHGADQTLAQAAIQRVVEDVNIVFRRELNVQLDLIDNLDIIFGGGNPDPDPYPADALTAVGVNQTELDARVGSANYDIGVVFGTFADGGRARLGGAGVDGMKGEFAAGLAETPFGPVGPPFLDIVIHEFGHHLNANHTFNSTLGACGLGGGDGRNATTAFEPGGGTTILSYAGLCPAVFSEPPTGDNVANFGDPYFHAGSLDEIVPHLESLDAAGVGTSTPANAVPHVNAGPDFTIPANTPFYITAMGADTDDPDGDMLWYTIEEMDLGPAQSIDPASDNGSSPLFRSFPPARSRPEEPRSFTRVFPQLSDVLDGTTTKGELLPSTSRTLEFRATVRDDDGGTSSDDSTLTVVDTGSPFMVTSPNTAVSLGGGTMTTVTWDVAGTDANGIDTLLVDIWLSVDGGRTFPLLLATTDNDGMHDIVVPNFDASTARIKVAGSGNIFFDVSDTNFTITADGGAPGVTIVESSGSTDVAENAAIQSDTDTYTVGLNTVPSGPVEITVMADAESEVSLDGTTFTPAVSFTRSDTSTQTISVRALDDSSHEGPHTSTISHTITFSSDPTYPVTLVLPNVLANVIDNELVPLIGVDFQGVADGGTVPINWNQLTGATDIESAMTFPDLIRETGSVTPYDLTITPSPSSSFSTQAAPANSPTVPRHSQPLGGIDDVFRWRNPTAAVTVMSVDFTFSELIPGADYAVYVFANEANIEIMNQLVTITGSGVGDPPPFVQTSTDGTRDFERRLIINDEEGRALRDLSSFAKTVTADGSGVININVTRDDGVDRNRLYLAGLAIQEVTAASTPPATLVINEVQYDEPGADTAEFIELLNVGGATVNLDAFVLELIDAAGSSYRTIGLPDFDLPPGAYFVVSGNAATVPNTDLVVSPSTDFIDNGAPNAVALMRGPELIDTVSYEGDTPAPFTEGSGTGLADDGALELVGISRVPDGTDTDVNNVDFAPACITPGAANVDFTSGCAADLRGVKFDDVDGNFRRAIGIQGTAPHVVYVIDVSGSTEQAKFAGTPVGDLNGDGSENDVIDAEIAAFIALNNDLASLVGGPFTSVTISVVAFSSDPPISGGAEAQNMDPTGSSLVTAPDADADSSGTRDVEEVLGVLQGNGLTNFEAALNEALSVFQTVGTLPANANMVFLSDGFPQPDQDITQEVAALNTFGANLRAFGVGQNARLDDLSIIDPDALIFTSTNELLGVFGGGGAGPLGEPGIGGVTIFVDIDGDGVRDAEEPFDVTDADGSWRISNVPPGTYTVREEVPPGSVPTLTPFEITTFPGDDDVRGLDFGNYTLVTLSGVKFLDLDGDGVQDPGEPPLENIPIFLDETGPDQMGVFSNDRTEFTDATGRYTFANVGPPPLDTGGTPLPIAIFESDLPGFRQTAPLSPSLHLFVPLSGMDRDDLDFGNELLVTAEKIDALTVDSSGDGLADAGDRIKYTVTITNNDDQPLDNVVFTDTPDANTALVVGSVMVSLPAATVNSGNGGGDTTVDVSIPTIDSAASVTIMFEVDVVAFAAMGFTNQGLVTGQDFTLMTDDPDLSGREDPTVTPGGAPPLDFGDAPDSPYPTLLANDGPRHTASSLFLGPDIDFEADGQPDLAASGDDFSDRDDEDGVTFTSELLASQTASITVEASVSGLLNAFLDFNNDGDWLDAGEQIFTDELISSGFNPLTFAVPADAVTASTFARFRLNTVGGLSFTGPASDGEVEDYCIAVGQFDLEAEKVDEWIDVDSSGDVTPGDLIRYTVTISNNGQGTHRGIGFSEFESDSAHPGTTLVAGSATTTRGSVLFGNTTGDRDLFVDVGDLASGEQATIVFEVTVDMGTVPEVLFNQGHLSSSECIGGAPFFETLTNDPDTPAPDDPTGTPRVPAFAAVSVAKSVTDVNSGDVERGDVLQYSIVVTNSGTRDAEDVVLSDAIPPNTVYVAGSLEITAGANAGGKTDVSGDDQGEFDSGNNGVVFRLGDLADDVSGGTLGPGQSATVQFQVQVSGIAPSQTQIDNQAFVQFFGGGSTGETAESNIVSVTTAPAGTVVVINSTGDDSDSTPGDGLCDTGNTIADGSPECTLRAGIEETNARQNLDSQTPDELIFDIPDTDPGMNADATFTIAPDSPLPAITDEVIIDASTQPGAVCRTDGQHVLRIEVSGQNAGGPSVDGLASIGDAATIRGFVINRFTGNGIFLRSIGNVVQCNFIGTDATGTMTGFGNGENGVLIFQNSDNLVGGSTAADGNLISGNTGTGVLIDENANNNRVLGNRIGTDVTGTLSLPNLDSGVEIYNSRDNQVGSLTVAPGLAPGNLISGNTGSGVLIASGIAIDPSQFNTVQGNLIGTTFSGDGPLSNTNSGVRILDSFDNTVGGVDTPSDGLTPRNVISGNLLVGVAILEGPDPSPADRNVVQNNFIGTATDGLSPLGNGTGVEIDGSDNLVQENVIAFNASLDTGVAVLGGTGNSILMNSIHSNPAGLGINLVGGSEDSFGVTANDDDDPDTGANNLQNFPVLTEIVNDMLTGTLNSNPNRTYRLEFFSQPPAEIDPSGFGEGKTFLFFSNHTSNAVGDLSFQVNLSGTVPAGHFVTATATDTTTGDTSEFSNAVAAAAACSTVVTHTGDTGVGSLREAIICSNDTQGVDTITFEIPETDGGFNPNNGPAGAFTIRPLSPLPTITDPLIIAGDSQAGAACNTNATDQAIDAALRIELDGSQAGVRADGVHVTSGGSTIRGLVINRFDGDGIHLELNGGNTVECNFIGTDVSGSLALGNAENGVEIDNTSGNTVGGATAAARNLISGNLTNGVLIHRSGATGNVVQGNFIGTDINGTADLGNVLDGVQILTASDNVVGGAGTGEGNLISGNDWSGVHIRENSTGNQVLGNLVGTDVSGTLALGNSDYGIALYNAQNNLIGDLTPTPGTGPGNVISSNGESGVDIDSGSSPVAQPSSNNTVRGNIIGLDITGTSPLGNAEQGVAILDAELNTIGGPDVQARNIISANRLEGVAIVTGVTTEGVPADNNLIQNNFIGTDIGGTLDLGNLMSGVSIDGANDTRVLDNTIAFNSLRVAATGIVIFSGTGNVILGNSIFDNVGLGINLVGGTEDSFGVTANDTADPDTGPNNLQNYPDLVSATREGGNTVVAGNLNSLPNSLFLIEFFSNVAADPSGFGEGQVPIQTTLVTTDSQGDASFNVTLPVAVPVGQFITSTATLATDGGLLPIETSEFSNAVAVQAVDVLLDFGDAPAPFPTSLPDGARHAVTDGIRLGAEIDAEVDGQPDPNALGDDNAGTDDEDGVTGFAAPLVLATEHPLSVSVAAPGAGGFLNAWVDFNDDGDWNDPGEQIFKDLLLAGGTHMLTFDVPPDATPGTTFARFRWSTKAGLGPAGVDNEFQWLQLADIIGTNLGAGIEGAAGGIIGDTLYVSHGFGPSAGAGGGDGMNLYLYDINTNTWSTGPTASFPRSELMGAVVDDRLYAIGGRTDPNQQIVEIFDPATNMWTRGADMPTGRGGAGAGTINGRIHVVGGRPGGSPGSGPPLDAHEVYDPLSNTWTSAAPLPTAVQDAYATVALDGRLYVIGGEDVNGPVNLVQIYDPTTDMWSMGAEMPTPRSNAFAGTFDGRIFVVGGVDASDTNLNVTEVYDPVMDSWSAGPDKPDPGSEFATGLTFNEDTFFLVGSGIFGAAEPFTHALTFTVVDGEVEDYEVEIVQANGSISGIKFEDLDGNGLQDTVAAIPDVQLAPQGPVILDRNDDGSTGAIGLGFTFEFFGNDFTQIFINNNGNVTFNTSLSAFTPQGFPQSEPIVAPFWADVDTRNGSSGVVHLATGTSPRGNPFVQVDWDNVGLFAQRADLLNDFTLYIEDDPAGDIVLFDYGNMQWTTGDVDSPAADGFGGPGAQIGFDAGDGTNFLSLGRPDSPASLAAFSNTRFAFRIDPSGIPVRPESGLGGVTIFLDNNGDGMLGGNEPSVVTQTGTGAFQLNDVPPGTHLVCEAVPAGFVNTLPAGSLPCQTVVVGPGEDVTSVDFGNQPLVDGVNSIRGFVYVDVDNDGIKDPQEVALPNVPVTITGPVTRTVLTDSSGGYAFLNLPAGVYNVLESQPSAFLDGKETRGNPALGVARNDLFEGLALTGNINATDYNFGERGLHPSLISKALFLASTPPPDQLLSVRRADAEGEWFVLGAGLPGTLTIRGTGSTGASALELYAEGMRPAAIAGGEGEMVVQAGRGEQYLLHIPAGRSISDYEITLEPHWLFNKQNSLDTNRDGAVSSLDALVVINALNGVFLGNLNSIQLDAAPDANRDSRLSSMDALWVVNYLNQHTAAAARGEGESSRDAEAVEILARGARLSTGSLLPPAASAASGLSRGGHRPFASDDVDPASVSAASREDLWNLLAPLLPVDDDHTRDHGTRERRTGVHDPDQATWLELEEAVDAIVSDVARIWDEL